MDKLQIEEVYPKNTGNPILLRFQNGYTNDNFKTTDCLLLNKSNSQKKTVVTALDSIIYSGEEKGEELAKTFLVARNRKTNIVRIIEVNCAELKPITKVDLDRTQQMETSNLELSRKFGSKRQKKKMEQKEKLKINIESVTDQMKNISKSVVVDKLDLSLYSKTNTDEIYIPPINKEASKVEDVYDIDQILTEEQYERIYSEIENKDIDHVSIVKNIIDKRSLSRKLTVIAIYASTLINMYLSQSKEFSRKHFVICPVSNTLNEIVLANFTQFVNNRRARPSTLKDKALCHAIVFLLLLNNFKFEIEQLSTLAKLTIPTMSIKARAVGAHIVTSNDKKYVQLKIPLNTNTGIKRRQSTRF